MHHRRPTPIGLALATATILGAGSPALAQTLEQRGFQPVEQLVDDVDPLTQSLRQIPTGLREQAGQESLVYRRPGAADPDRLYYIEPGLVAEFDRSEYFVIQDGPILQLIPPDTVFHLGFPPGTEPHALPDQPDPPLRIDPRQDPRILGRAARLRLQGPTPTGTPAGSPDADRPDWDGYMRMLASQRRSVTHAIDRALAGDLGEGP